MSTGPVDRGDRTTPAPESDPRRADDHRAREYDGFEDRSRDTAADPDHRDHDRRDSAHRDSERHDLDRRDADRRPARDTTSPRDVHEPVEEPRSGGRTAGIWLALICGAIILILLLIFVIQNNVPATFQYFGAEFDLPLGVAMLLAAIAGALVMALVGSVRMIQMSWTIRKMRKQQERIRQAAR